MVIDVYGSSATNHSECYKETLQMLLHGWVWTSANDGVGSGLDADLLGGLTRNQLSIIDNINTAMTGK